MDEFKFNVETTVIGTADGKETFEVRKQYNEVLNNGGYRTKQGRLFSVGTIRGCNVRSGEHGTTFKENRNGSAESAETIFGIRRYRI